MKRLLILMALLATPAAQAEEQGLGPVCDTLYEDALVTSSASVTTTAIPVGNARAASIGVRVRALGASESVTINTVALENTGDSVSNLASGDTKYHLPISTGGELVITANGATVYPIEWPGGCESLKFTVTLSSAGGAYVKIVGCSK